MLNRFQLYQLVLFIGLIGGNFLAILLPHPWNLTPTGAIAIFAGMYLYNRWLSLLAPLLGLLAANLFQGFSPIWYVYISFMLITCLGAILRNSSMRFEKQFLLGIPICFLSAMLFFLVTNFFCWLGSTTYPQTLEGLGDCYIMAIPFFWNTLYGDLFYFCVLMGLMAPFYPVWKSQSQLSTAIAYNKTVQTEA